MNLSGRAYCSRPLRKRNVFRWWRVWNAINDIAGGDIPVACPLCRMDIAIEIGLEPLARERTMVTVRHVPVS